MFRWRLAADEDSAARLLAYYHPLVNNPPLRKIGKTGTICFKFWESKSENCSYFFQKYFEKWILLLFFSEMLRWGFILRILCFVFASFLPRKIEKVPKIPQNFSPRFARGFISPKISQKIATGLILFKFSFSKNEYCSYCFQNIS